MAVTGVKGELTNKQLDQLGDNFVCSPVLTKRRTNKIVIGVRVFLENEGL